MFFWNYKKEYDELKALYENHMAEMKKLCAKWEALAIRAVDDHAVLSAKYLDLAKQFCALVENRNEKA
jgi:hypothetical protein